MGAPVQPSYTQAVFRGRNDNGTESSATWIASTDTNFTLQVSTTFRLRFRVQQTVTNANTNLAKNFKLRFSDGGSYTDIGAQGTTASKVRYVNSSNITDNETTTNQLGTGTGSFIAGSVDENNDTGTITFTSGAASYTEIEFVIEVYGPLVDNNDAISFRVYETNDTVLDTYTVTPNVTVKKAITAQSALNSTTSSTFLQKYKPAGLAGLIASSVLTSNAIMPQPNDGFRTTEQGDYRVIESTVFRITEKLVEAFSQLSANGIVSSTGEIIANLILYGDSSLSSTATLQNVGLRKTNGTILLSSLSSLHGLGEVVRKSSSSLSSSSSLQSSSKVIKYGTNSLQSIASLTPTAQKLSIGYSNLTSSGSSLYAGINYLVGRSELNSSSSLVNTGILTTFGTTALQGNSSTNVDSQLTTYGEVTLNGTGTISANGKYIVSSSFSSTSSLGADVSLIIYGQVQSLLVNFDREIEEEDLRLTEQDDQRISEDALTNVIYGSIVAESTLKPFSSTAYIKKENVWKEFIPFVKFNGVWVTPEKTYRKENGMWKRIY